MKQGETPPGVAELIKDLIAGKTVCDIGCGDGSFMQFLAKYASKVSGIEEQEELAKATHEKGFDVMTENYWFFPFPKADVYYSWSKDSPGVYMKLKWEGKKGILILGNSVRPFFKEFIKTVDAGFREFNDPFFEGVYIIRL